MHDLLKNNVFLIKEHVGMFKAANNYDIHDPASGEVIMECREEGLGFLTKLFRFSKYKRMTPFDISIRTPDGQQLLRITRGISIFLSTVQVLDEKDQYIGGVKQKLFLAAPSPCSTPTAVPYVNCRANGPDGTSDSSPTRLNSRRSAKNGRVLARRCSPAPIITHWQFPRPYQQITWPDN